MHRVKEKLSVGIATVFFTSNVSFSEPASVENLLKISPKERTLCQIRKQPGGVVDVFAFYKSVILANLFFCLRELQQ